MSICKKQFSREVRPKSNETNITHLSGGYEKSSLIIHAIENNFTSLKQLDCK